MPASFGRQPQGRKLFSFAVIADTHVNESEDGSASPFVTNAGANARARHAFGEIAVLDPAPDFVIHLGDIVHPVPSLPSFEEAARRFRDIAALIPMPLHLVPGNHDVGDKSIDWMPADVVCDAYLDKYRSLFGPDYHAFDHGGIRFLLVNALLFNSGLASEAAQQRWMDKQIETAPGRVFVFIHYPPYLYERNERGSYDNIDEPGRAWLLARMEHPKVEALFAGHVHNFWYDVVGNAEMYMLPSTAFLRHDFSEFYRVAAKREHGRGDMEKFGYFVVDVYERGHVAQLIRTHGASRAEDDVSAAAPPLPPTHPKVSPLSRIGVELRHDWAEVVQIPCTGGVQEFGRKPARNDYPVMALWEMGMRLLKVPTQDLRDERSAARAAMMSDIGHEFVLTSLGLPGPDLLRSAAARGIRLRGVELNLTGKRFLESRAAIADLREATDAALYFCKIRATEDAHFDGRHYSHFVNTGLRLEELACLPQPLVQALRDKELDGVTVRLDWGTDLPAAHARLEAFAADMECRVLASVKLADRLATANEDDARIALLAAQALIVSRAGDRVSYVFDTFMDVDRGYFPRNAFIDRRFDPRAAGRTVAALAALLPAGALRLGAAANAGVRSLEFELSARRYALLYGPGRQVAARLRQTGCARATDLLAGRCLPAADGAQMPPGLDGDAPALVLAG